MLYGRIHLARRTGPNKFSNNGETVMSHDKMLTLGFGFEPWMPRDFLVSPPFESV